MSKPCTKIFDPVHYSMFDATAKNAAANFFSQFGFEAYIPHTEKYSYYDLIVFNKEDNIKYLVEVEVKNV